MKKSPLKARYMVLLGMMLALTLVSVLFELVWPPSLTQAGATLPPREPPQSTSDKGDHTDNKQSLGAYIELQIQPSQVGLWTIVQWQDSAGEWRDVEGWRGNLDEGGKKKWQVAAKDFGKGPFRWIVTERPSGPLLATSDPFNLPAHANEVMQIEVSLRP